MGFTQFRNQMACSCSIMSVGRAALRVCLVIRSVTKFLLVEVDYSMATQSDDALLLLYAGASTLL